MLSFEERVHNLDYDSAVAMRYHGKRRSFCENVAKAGTGLSLILGTAAFAAVSSKVPEVAALATGLVAIINAANLAFGTADAGRRHGEIFRRWGELRADLAKITDGDDKSLRALEVTRAKIDAESPTQLDALSVLCENAEKEMRREEPLYHVPTLPRLLANFVDVPGWEPKEVVSAHQQLSAASQH
ncbi:hypothetical protein JMJ56_22010 [Belnapia sp. T18]|uniref:SMODS and SLOG-associating 2TM effector domain-containing protein n=1 Tax=Belnapia arida TaxID=2804533 RepID=A0ABS1UBR4_9PROT|nr:hypothetical protein [Belnapia arida]MBL6080696.1 hypothetical protein [Belnapia arida]